MHAPTDNSAPRDPSSTDFCSCHYGYLWATPLLVAALLFWVGCLNLAAAHSAPPRA